MSDPNVHRPIRLVGLALAGIGTLELAGLVAGPLLTGEAHLTTTLCALPAGLALLSGRTGWVTPAVRVVQALVVVVAALGVAALFGAGFSFPVTAYGNATDLAGGGERALAGALAAGQAALWVWVFELGRRLVASEPDVRGAV